MKAFFTLLLIILFTYKVDANCPQILMPSELSKLPLCPEGAGTNLLPETYPVGVFVISDRGYSYDPDFTVAVVEKVLKATGENNPLILLPVQEETVVKIKSRIDALEISKEQKEKWKASLRPVSGTRWTWQQDYMQPYLNYQTGQIVIREVAEYNSTIGYGTGKVDAQKVFDAGKDCGIAMGQKIFSSNRRASGTFGGNIEALPGGVCLLGRDSFINDAAYDEYVKNACGESAQHHIKVPTSWLKVGHTDEIMKVVRNKNRPAPCDFSVVLASPQKGLDLLRKNPASLFFNFPSNSYELPTKLARRRLNEDITSSTVCRKYLDMKRKKQNRQNNPIRSTNGVSKVFDFIKMLYPDAFAGATVVDYGDESLHLECFTMTNGEAYNLFTKNDDFREYNELVQEKIDELKSNIKNKLKERLPQCNVDFIEAPDLFYGGPVVENEKGKKELPNNKGLSLLPNPTNAITINDTVISPDPSNIIFKRYLEEEYRKRGLYAEFVDTFDYAHKGEGNLHCTTNTMHICRPRGGK